jgi:hypothetical protein
METLKTMADHGRSKNIGATTENGCGGGRGGQAGAVLRPGKAGWEVVVEVLKVSRAGANPDIGEPEGSSAAGLRTMYRMLNGTVLPAIGGAHGRGRQRDVNAGRWIELRHPSTAGGHCVESRISVASRKAASSLRRAYLRVSRPSRLGTARASAELVARRSRRGKPGSTGKGEVEYA